MALFLINNILKYLGVKEHGVSKSHGSGKKKKSTYLCLYKERIIKQMEQNANNFEFRKKGLGFFVSLKLYCLRSFVPSPYFDEVTI